MPPTYSPFWKPFEILGRLGLPRNRLDVGPIDMGPPEVQDEIIRINTEARPISLQVALLVPLIAGLLGLVTSFRMVRLGDTKPAASLEGVGFG